MSVANAGTREVFQFSAPPRAVKSRGKYREQTDTKQTDNDTLQNDPRVRTNRPNTIPYRASRASVKSNNLTARGNTHGQTEEIAPEFVYAPISDRKPQDEAKLVPDYYVDRPPTPEFKPLPPGVDVATQIEDNELFDYIVEVEPVLQVLVGKTIEQAQIELREDDERIEEMRHKMRFEKVRNAELMVTQRKEALHIRKQDEKKRREKQHIIEKEEKIIIHRKLISRLFGKNVLNAMDSSSIRILADQNVLRVNIRSELRRLYNPYLFASTLDYLNQHTHTQSDVDKVLVEVSSHYSRAHSASVQQEVDRIKKIHDDKKAEEERQAAARKRRRERRRLLRLHFAKANFLDRILVTVITKGQDIEGPFSGDVSDIFPTGKETIGTIGGLLGELWLILDALQQERHLDLSTEQLVNVFVHLLNEKFKGKDLNIFLNEEYQPLMQDLQDRMAADLIEFNQNKRNYINEVAEQLGEVNLFQNLGILHAENLLNPATLRHLNKALLYIFFTSLDYKIPEKKPVDTENQSQPAEEVVKTEGEESQPPAEGDVNILNTESQEEEFKLPEVTPFEQATEQAKKRLKLNYVKDWEFKKDCDAVLRLRIPLNRNVKEQEEEKVGSVIHEDKPTTQTDLNASIRTKKTAKEVTDHQVTAVTEPQEDFADKVERLIATDDFIEPYDGTTFEGEKKEFTEQAVDAGAPLRVYNTGLVEGKTVVQINEKGQEELRKELLAVIKEHIPGWKDMQDEDVLAKVYVKYKKNEKIIIDGLISDPEQTPVFDVEN